MKKAKKTLAGYRPEENRTRRFWRDLKQYCFNPNSKGYQHYGAKGYYLAPEWMDYEQFLADVGEKPSRQHKLSILDKRLCKKNCKWVLPSVQTGMLYSSVSSNQRYEKFKELRAKFWTLKDIREELEISKKTVERMSKKFRKEMGIGYGRSKNN